MIPRDYITAWRAKVPWVQPLSRLFPDDRQRADHHAIMAHCAREVTAPDANRPLGCKVHLSLWRRRVCSL
jgi:hypothetical protein